MGDNNFNVNHTIHGEEQQLFPSLPVVEYAYLDKHKNVNQTNTALQANAAVMAIMTTMLLSMCMIQLPRHHLLNPLCNASKRGNLFCAKNFLIALLALKESYAKTDNTNIFRCRQVKVTRSSQRKMGFELLDRSSEQRQGIFTRMLMRLRDYCPI
uniref:Uncharacterized protein n=1 Tax=Glossina pallidipes TaxID=7398 RepID=A0A1A9ZR25_GLOPL